MLVRRHHDELFRNRRPHRRLGIPHRAGDRELARGGEPSSSSDGGRALLGLPAGPVKSTQALAGTIATFIDGESITFHLDAVGGAELPGTIDGAATPAAVPAGGGATVTVSPAGVAEGPHTIYAVATPSDDYASAAVTIDDTAPPTPTIDSSPPTTTTATSASFSFSDAESGVSFECRVDGAGFAPCTSPIGYSSLTDASHTFQVRAVDTAGNHSAAASFTWTVDTTPPTATLTFPVNGAYYNVPATTPGALQAPPAISAGLRSTAAPEWRASS